MELIPVMETIMQKSHESETVSNAGRPPRVSDDEILSVFREADDPFLTASEVADALPIGRRGVYKRLVALAEEGQLGRKDIGGSSTGWWLLEDAE